MFVVGWVDTATRTTSGISIPCLLSFLAYQDIHATVQGVDYDAPAPTPPINLLFQVYHFHDHEIWTRPGRDRHAGRAVVPVAAAAVRVTLRPVAAGPGRPVFIGEATITAGWWTAEVGRPGLGRVQRPQDRRWRVAGPQRPTMSSCRWGCWCCTGCSSSCSCTCSIARSRDGPEGERGCRDGLGLNLPDTFRDVFSRSRRAADLGDKP